MRMLWENIFLSISEVKDGDRSFETGFMGRMALVVCPRVASMAAGPQFTSLTLFSCIPDFSNCSLAAPADILLTRRT